MKIRSTHTRAAGLALIAALSVAACSKAPAGIDGQAGQAGQGSEQSVAGSTRTINVQSKVSQLKVHADPSESSPVVNSLKDTTKLGSKTTLLVTQSTDGWYQVQLPTRPNGSTGWVEATDVQARNNDMVVNVDLGGKTVTVTKDAQVVVTTPVAIGAGDTPTPSGTFYVTDFVKSDAGGDYGPFAFGLSGHSEKLTEFAGGDGQIGVHGTNQPASIGQAVSHGCIRLPNDVVTQLSTMLPLGTPVVIS